MTGALAFVSGCSSLWLVYYLIRIKSLFSLSAILLAIMSVIPYFLPVEIYTETWMFTKPILQTAINADEAKLFVNAFTLIILTSFVIISRLNVVPKITFHPYAKVPLLGILILISTSQVLHALDQRAISDYFTVATTILILSVLSNSILFEEKITLKVSIMLLIYAGSILSRGATKELMILIVPVIYLILNQDISLVSRAVKLVLMAVIGMMLFAVRELFRFIYWYDFEVKISDLFSILFYESERTYSIFELLIVRAQNFYWNVGAFLNVTSSLSDKFIVDWLWALVPRLIFPLKPTELRNANEFGREIGFLSQFDFTTAANIPLVADLIVLSDGNLWAGGLYILLYVFLISVCIGVLLIFLRKERFLKQFQTGATLSTAAWLMVAVDSGVVIWGTLWFKLLVAVIIIYLLRRLKLA